MESIVIGHSWPTNHPVTASKPASYGALKDSLTEATYADVRSGAPSYAASTLKYKDES